MSKRPSKIERADLHVAHKAATVRDSLPVRVAGTLSELADQPQLYSICWAVIAFGVFMRRRQVARTGMRMLAAEWLATKAKSAIKHRIDRTRPAVPVEGGTYRMERGRSKDKPLNSFPSGHTAGAVAVARAYASEHPEHAMPAYAAAALVALVQIPRCKHYPTDIAAGAAIGLVAGSLVARVD